MHDFCVCARVHTHMDITKWQDVWRQRELYAARKCPLCETCVRRAPNAHFDSDAEHRVWYLEFSRFLFNEFVMPSKTQQAEVEEAERHVETFYSRERCNPFEYVC